MINWCYKWLPRIFGCHCRDDRSFHYKGRKFPICARCTGELAGMIASLLSCFMYRPSYWIIAILMLPMIVDGLVQMGTKYESNNRRRFLTGSLFGYGLMMFILLSTTAAFMYGVRLGHSL